MRSRLSILAAGLLFALTTSPVSAQEDGFVLWDQSIASAVSGLPDEERCGASPYALYGPRCRARLNLSFDRPILYFTFLDRAALFLYKYHRLNYKQGLWRRTKLKFEINLENVYKQEAEARIELRYRFSSELPRFELFGLSESEDLPAPSFSEN
jgi:hypothetical protein